MEHTERIKHGIQMDLQELNKRKDKYWIKRDIINQKLRDAYSYELYQKYQRYQNICDRLEECIQVVQFNEKEVWMVFAYDIFPHLQMVNRPMDLQRLKKHKGKYMMKRDDLFQKLGERYSFVTRMDMESRNRETNLFSEFSQYLKICDRLEECIQAVHDGNKVHMFLEYDILSS
jgi:hypothetical protein